VEHELEPESRQGGFLESRDVARQEVAGAGNGSTTHCVASGQVQAGLWDWVPDVSGRAKSAMTSLKRLRGNAHDTRTCELRLGRTHRPRWKMDSR
jgi:hypothetical protein